MRRKLGDALMEAGLVLWRAAAWLVPDEVSISVTRTSAPVAEIDPETADAIATARAAAGKRVA